MNLILPVLLILAGLILVGGCIAIVSIVIVAKRCKQGSDNCTEDASLDGIHVDPWQEAGRRGGKGS